MMTMQTLAKIGTVAAVWAALVAPVAHADDGYDDDPGYQTDQGQMPCVEHWPAVCQTAPLACSWHRDPGSGAWLRPPAEPEH